MPNTAPRRLALGGDAVEITVFLSYPGEEVEPYRRLDRCCLLVGKNRVQKQVGRHVVHLIPRTDHIACLMPLIGDGRNAADRPKTRHLRLDLGADEGRAGAGTEQAKESPTLGLRLDRVLFRHGEPDEDIGPS